MIILNAMQSLIRNVTPTYILPSKCNRSCRMTYPSKHTQPIILPSYNPLYEKRIKPLYEKRIKPLYERRIKHRCDDCCGDCCCYPLCIKNIPIYFEKNELSKQCKETNM